ncbi:MAG: hypothetical protein HY812_18635, partial [Planctomycetes bacterium]|nr:hypothetical protein [Planctomycetota bacterium]
LLYLGSTPAQLPIPPHGTLLLDPAGYFQPLLTLSFPFYKDRYTLALPIPSDPGLIGLTARFQAAVGDLVPGSSATYFSDRADLTIQP